MKNQLFFLILSLFPFTWNFAQDYSFEDFIGSWNGYISSNNFGGYNDPMRMIIEEDGFYTETSGHLMPTIYPNTQQSQFDESTNRYHWWYLQTVYAGQSTYQHFYYEVVYFQNDTLEMHYNFWDDPEPHPEAGTIFLVRETAVSNNYLLAPVINPYRKLLKVFDLTGREVDPQTSGGIFIYLYDDGTRDKRYINNPYMNNSRR